MMDLIGSVLQLLLISSFVANLTSSAIREGDWGASVHRKRSRSGRSVSRLTPARYGPNVCYIQQNNAGCRLRITVFPDECGLPGHESLNNGIGKRDLNERKADSISEDAKSLLKLEAIEQKLTRMMEDLSVRSLRHVREIRADLRLMAQSMDDLKTGSEGNSDGRGESSYHPVRQCPSEFIGVGTWRSCYRFSNFEATWSEAREYCGIFGAALLSMDSMKESNIIDYLIKSSAAFQEPIGWWTGGNSISRNQRWTWSLGQSTYQSINFTRWAPGQPPSSMTSTHCIALFKPAKYFWHGVPCTERHQFICQLNSLWHETEKPDRKNKQ